MLVSYDISENKPRRQMADLLLDLGLQPIQKSVYFGYLSRAEIQALAREGRKLLDADTDSLFWVRVDLPAVIDHQCLGHKPRLDGLKPDGYAIL